MPRMMAVYIYLLYALLEYPDITCFFSCKGRYSLTVLCKIHLDQSPGKAKIHEHSGFC